MDTAYAAGTQPRYKNFAFISYSSRDKAWGKKLQRALEHYRLPARLRRRYEGRPSRAYPIFRDETDLAGFKVWDALEKELMDSQYLIVICSPRSAASQWVNDEVQFFIDQGREDRILPFILEGIPDSGDPETECFPPALRAMEEEPLGVDRQALGWRKAYLRMISTLLNVRYDELLLRDTRRRVRNGIFSGILSLGLALSACQFVWSSTEHSKYYNTYTTRMEIPVGIGELSKKERASMSDCYRITSQGNQVVRLELVNSLGTVTDPLITTSISDYPILEYQYNDDGDLVCILQKDSLGKEVSRKILTVNEATNEIGIEFRTPSNALDAQALSANMVSSVIGDTEDSVRSEITRLRNTYDQEGYLIRSLYQRDNLGTPACDGNGVFGKLYQYNDQGLVSRISNLDKDGNVFNCKYGWAYEEFLYDQRGNEILSQFYDADGNNVSNERGVAAVRVEYDAVSNITAIWTLDENGQPVFSSQGFAGQVPQYDDQGLLTDFKYLDPQGSATHDQNGVHGIQCSYDEKGRLYRTSAYDIHGNPAIDASTGVCSVEYLRDENGYIRECWNYDTHGKLSADKESGVCGFRYSWDNGYCVKIEYLDNQGNLTLSKNGYAVLCREYDDNGHILWEATLDAQEKPVRALDGAASLKMSYDTFGNCTSFSHLDENGEPCICTDGYATARCTYQNGLHVSSRFFDTEGAPMLIKALYHEVRWEYDEIGNTIKKSYYDTEENLTESTDGYAVATYQQDSHGNATELSFFTADGQNAFTRDIYKFERTYDQRGNCIREVCHSANPQRLDYVIVESEYDLHGNCTQVCYYDENGNWIFPDKGACRRVSQYDEKGNTLREESYYADAHMPEEDALYLHSFNVYQYDDFGNITLAQTFSLDDSGEMVCAYQQKYTYDAYGNMERYDYMDGDGNLTLTEDGYASFVLTYTPDGLLLSQEFYDEKGNPCLYSDGTFRSEFQYNAYGSVIETRHYGTDGTPLKEENRGLAIIQVTYDSLQNEIKKSFFNENGEPFGALEGVASSVEFVWDDFGYVVERIYYDHNGEIQDTKHFSIYVDAVQEGSSAAEAGLTEGDWLVLYGDWNYFAEHPVSSQHDFQEEQVKTFSREKKVLVARAEGSQFVFREYTLPAGATGLTFSTGYDSRDSLASVKRIYERWNKWQNSSAEPSATDTQDAS